MRLITSSLVAAGAVAGIVGAAVTYQSVAGGNAVAHKSVAAPATAEPTPTVTTKLLPCEPGTKLVKGTCVRIQHRVVVREAAAPAVASAGRSQGADRTPRTRDRDDDHPSRPRTPQSDDDHGTDSDDEPDHDESEDHEDESEDREDHEDDHDEYED